MTRPYNPLEGDRPAMSVKMLQEGTEEQISIIVVHKDTPEYLNIALQSIAVTSLNVNYELIVVDNASTLKDSTDFLDDLEQQGECKIIKNKENVWWSKAANIGARAANKKSKYLVFMHSDIVILNPAWLDLLVNVSESQESGLIGVSMNSYYMDKQKIDFIEEWCMMVTRDCFDDVGGFCEELPMVGAPFLFTIAAQYADHKPQIIRNQIVHHYSVFGMDVNLFEQFSEKCLLQLPVEMRTLQSKIRKKKIKN